MTVTWTCSDCHGELHLSGTLWRDIEDNPFCGAAVPDPVAEQYAAAGLSRVRPRTAITRMHRPSSSWVHPSMAHNATPQEHP